MAPPGQTLRHLERHRRAALLAGLAVVLACTFALALWMGKTQSPQPAVATQRISGLEEVLVEFQIACAGGANGPRLFRAPMREDAADPVLLRLPAGLDDPESSEAAVPGNQFRLRGYWANGQIGRKRFELISWKAISPYRIYDGKGEAAPVDRALEASVGEVPEMSFDDVQYGAFSCP